MNHERFNNTLLMNKNRRWQKRKALMISKSSPSKGSLIVVGTGIKYRSHMTFEALEAIKRAEKLFYLMSDIMSEKWLQEMNPSAESLQYDEDRPRKETYENWVELLLSSVRQGQHTCLAVYGHPGVLAYCSKKAIPIARSEGYKAVMLPGISAEACLLCDLHVDPGEGGLQSYKASEFLFRKPVFDTRSHLVLWDVAFVDYSYLPTQIYREGLKRLSEYLIQKYGAEHEVVVYEASRNPALDPIILSVPLNDLAKARFGGRTMLYVPPLKN